MKPGSLRVLRSAGVSVAIILRISSRVGVPGSVFVFINSILERAADNKNAFYLKMGLGAMKIIANLSAQEYREMREMLKNLTPAERASLEDPEFITEDEADLIICDRREKTDGPSIPLEQILKEFGTSPRRRRV
jgi:hypothetical protein